MLRTHLPKINFWTSKGLVPEPKIKFPYVVKIKFTKKQENIIVFKREIQAKGYLDR